MRSFFLFVVVLGGLVWPASVSAQVYHLVSAEGQPASVSLSYKLFSKRLAVSCANDSLFLTDYQGTESVKVLQNRFLEINYYVRCGSDCGILHTAIIVVRQHKLRVALLIESATERGNYEIKGLGYRYRVNLTMPGKSTDPYTIQAQIWDEAIVPGSPMQNHNIHQQAILHWDEARQLFYSALEAEARCLPVFDEKGAYLFDPSSMWVWQLARPYPAGYAFQDEAYFHVVPQWVVGTVPIVRLGNHLCYCIRGEWYLGRDDFREVGWFMNGYVKR